MSRLRAIKVVVGFSVALGAGSAWADSSPFVGRWHWDRVQSRMPPGEPVPSDVTAEISRADSTHLKWSYTVLDSQGQSSLETFDAPANGEFYPISTDELSCTVGSDQKTMACKGVLNDGKGHTSNYADVYHRM
jgi:hypothetical protein